jgi:hypothetical protein
MEDANRCSVREIFDKMNMNLQYKNKKSVYDLVGQE